MNEMAWHPRNDFAVADAKIAKSEKGKTAPLGNWFYLSRVS